MEPTAMALARWAGEIEPTSIDLELARSALVDTLAVARAADGHPSAALADQLGPAGRLAFLAHLLDYDDLHVPSTAHVSAVCVPVALACDGGPRAFLAGAGVMAQLGSALGWSHYAAGWHITCTAGAPAAAATAAVALGLDAEATARAIALALPGAGGVQRAFGTIAKPLQVGFAADAGMRAAELAAAGASADPAALDQWLELVGATSALDSADLDPSAETVPGGLAIKAFPCCYALQRPIAAVREAAAGPELGADPLDPNEVESIRVELPADVLQPLIHSRPSTGLEGKFSLEYALAATLLDGWPGLASFGDEAVARPAAQALLEKVRVETTPGGGGLLAGEVTVTITLSGGDEHGASVAIPPGAPGRPLTDEELKLKLTDCAGPAGAAELLAADWAQPSSPSSAAGLSATIARSADSSIPSPSS